MSLNNFPWHKLGSVIQYWTPKQFVICGDHWSATVTKPAWILWCSLTFCFPNWMRNVSWFGPNAWEFSLVQLQATKTVEIKYGCSFSFWNVCKFEFFVIFYNFLLNLQPPFTSKITENVLDAYSQILQEHKSSKQDVNPRPCASQLRTTLHYFFLTQRLLSALFPNSKLIQTNWSKLLINIIRISF